MVFSLAPTHTHIHTGPLYIRSELRGLFSHYETSVYAKYDILMTIWIYEVCSFAEL